MNPDTDSASAALRFARIFHRILSAAVILYVVIAETLAKPKGILSADISFGLGITAFVVVMIAYGYRRKLLTPAIKDLQRNPRNEGALFRWRKAQIVIMVLLVSVVLDGFVLRFMGGSLLVVLPFYLTSLVMLLIWRPREVVSEVGGTAPDSSEN